MSVFEIDVIGLPKPNYTYITTNEEARLAVEDISKYPIIEVDTETTALDPYAGKISLVQIGLPNRCYIFDVRNDTDHSTVDPQVLKPILTGNNQLRLLQNAVFDMKMIKLHFGFYIENIYDTMLVEQLLYLGKKSKYSLEALVFKYLGLTMEKEPRGTFTNYNQVFKPFQLEYAGNDVSVLRLIRDLQLPKIDQHNFHDVCRLEFEFTKPMCEMELNGIILDANRQRKILDEIGAEKKEYGEEVIKILSQHESQTTLFGVSLINIDSNVQLKKILNKHGLDLPDTAVGTLQKYKGLPVIDALLNYRKAQKFISTYGESLIARINEVTGRLHTGFKQMVSTGRLSSSDPNLQNIPKKQKYRNCFVSKDGYCLITADMSGAELRILGNLSQDPIFIDCFKKGIDLHRRTISEIRGIGIDEVTRSMRDAAKAINFGIPYGLSKFGLARRLGIHEKEAEETLDAYFERYRGIKDYLTRSKRDAVRNRYSMSISGRKRFYNIPPYNHPEYKKVCAAVERKGTNQPIQGGNADTIKQSMIYLVDRLEKSEYDARLLLSVHDEVVVEAKYDQRYEVRKIVEKSLIDGFGAYFHLIPMETDGLIGPCWLKNSCENKINDEECGHTEMVLNDNGDVICGKCGGLIK
jgi:DNA polymerase I-like protein with 3'-5' exonuclease and polymerase domains